ncbi:hypothetical protein ElyMa_000724800 [Elysia marginata]|uniref:Uncharacterized protein n=1 Tax=Elysia marginata TaxID=1093978 RepID=A0AAV4GNL1_9GAST|nr:hypothetical protein ElyMa_000724800 [Elysia marginata]
MQSRIGEWRCTSLTYCTSAAQPPVLAESVEARNVIEDDIDINPREKSVEARIVIKDNIDINPREKSVEARIVIEDNIDINPRAKSVEAKIVIEDNIDINPRAKSVEAKIVIEDNIDINPRAKSVEARIVIKDNIDINPREKSVEARIVIEDNIDINPRANVPKCRVVQSVCTAGGPPKLVRRLLVLAQVPLRLFITARMSQGRNTARSPQEVHEILRDLLSAQRLLLCFCVFVFLLPVKRSPLFLRFV